MADSPLKLLPTPLPRTEFLKSSHFKIGPEPRLLEGCMKTTFGSWFPAHWGIYTAVPFKPGPSKGLFHEDLEKIREITSEMHAAFPVHEVNSSPSSSNLMMQISNLKMHGDPRINIFKTLCQEKYTYPEPEAYNHFTKEARMQFDKDSFPSGDRDKLKIPLSHNRQVFVPQHPSPQRPAPSLHLGGPSHLKWGMEPYPDTSYRDKFRGTFILSPHICEKLKSHLKLGDSKIDLKGIHSEQKNAYTLQDLPQHRYNKKEAVANIFQVHIQPGDGQFHACPRSCQDMASVDISDLAFKPQALPDSFLPKGDQNPERCRERSNFTTNHHFFTWMKPEKSTTKQINMQKSHVILGEKNPKSNVMVTSHQKYFSYPKPSSSEIVTSHSLFESNIKLGTNEMDFLTTSRMLGPHSVKKNPVPEEIKQRVKYDHILPPSPDQEFTTEYKDNYPYKYTGPVILREGNFQESSVPLGLPQKHWSGKKMVIPC